MASNPDDHAYEFDDWPVRDREDAEFVGRATTMGGAGDVPVFFDPGTDSLFGGEVDEANREVVPDPDLEWDVDPDETLGEAIERIGDDVGWDSLSAFAEEHLQDEDG